jgi:hypothetical protein
MYHIIQFRADVDVEVSAGERLERVRVRKGSRFFARITAYVAEGPEGPVEMANLVWQDGAETRDLPFATFRFVDEVKG